MHTSTSMQSANGDCRNAIETTAKRLLLRKIWLPRMLYEALPYLYITCGLSSFLAAAFAPGWAWVLPYFILFGLVSLHAGLAVAMMRHKARARRKRSQFT